MARYAKIVPQRLRAFLLFAKIGIVSAPFQRHALRQAAAALGGEAQLRQFLDVPSAELSAWLRDRQASIPDQVMRTVIGMLADMEAGLISSAEQPAPKVIHRLS